MKKEELFDLLGQVDDKYIEEAMCDEFDSLRPVEVRAGKTKITPIKIIAPIAACLAVSVAAGYILKFSFMENIEPDTGITNNSLQNGYDLTSVEKDFLEKCKDIVLERNEFTEQDVKSWQTRKLDIDFDGEEEFLIYPGYDRYYERDLGVSVFGKSDGEPRDLGSFYLNNYGLNLDDIYQYSKDGVDAYCFYTSYGDYNVLPDGIYIRGVQRLYLNAEKNKVETAPELQAISVIGPNDAVIAEKYCIYNYNDELPETEIEVPESAFYTHWFSFPNAPELNFITAKNLEDCKNALQRVYSGLDEEKFLFKRVTIPEYYNNKERNQVILVDTQNENVPIYAFKITLNGVSSIGTIKDKNLYGHLDDIRIIDEYNDHPILYYISKTITEFGDEKISIEECSVNQIFTFNGEVAVKNYLSFGRDINDKIKIYYYRKNDADIAPIEFFKEWKRFDTSDIDDLS